MIYEAMPALTPEKRRERRSLFLNDATVHVKSLDLVHVDGDAARLRRLWTAGELRESLSWARGFASREEEALRGRPRAPRSRLAWARSAVRVLEAAVA